VDNEVPQPSQLLEKTSAALDPGMAFSHEVYDLSEFSPWGGICPMTQPVVNGVKRLKKPRGLIVHLSRPLSRCSAWSFDELHVVVQFVERLDALLRDSHPFSLRSTGANLEQFFDRVGYYLSTSAGRLSVVESLSSWKKNQCSRSLSRVIHFKY
jgi:hypothetical protein